MQPTSMHANLSSRDGASPLAVDGAFCAASSLPDGLRITLHHRRACTVAAYSRILPLGTAVWHDNVGILFYPVRRCPNDANCNRR